MDSYDILIRHLRRGVKEQSSLDKQAWLELFRLACKIPQEQTVDASVSIPDTVGSEEGPPLPVAFGPYVLLEKLGQGGMGIVYKARQEMLKRPVALKLVRAGVFASTQERIRFQREGEVIARIRHPHVVQIFEFGELQGQLYFSMELLDGGTLAHRLKGQPMPEREAAELVRTLAQAVEAAHQQGVVHRDLKPGNVLFASDGTAKITDFGLAKVLDEDSNETCSDAILGTAAYMAPEQARGESRMVSPLADVYALGVILYEALTGHPPFRGGTRHEVLDMVRSRQPEPLSSCRLGLSRDLEAICLKCLEKEPKRRYTSAAALADDLDRWLQGEPTTVRPPSWPGRVWRSVCCHARLISTVALILFVVGALFALSWYRDPQRPLRTLASELAHGRPQTLIAETGGPRWSGWCAGEASSQVSVREDGSFTLSSWQNALLELVPDPQRPSYRFSALVRQEKGFKQTKVGIYVAHCNHAHPAGLVHQFVALTFYDIERDVDAWANAASKTFPVQTPPPKGNRAKLLPHLLAETTPREWMAGPDRGPQFFFEPAGIGGQEWRELSVEVTPKGVTGFWSGKPMGTLLEPRLVNSVREYLKGEQKRNPDDPFTQGFDPIFVPRGGLGLYVYDAAASFRRVVVEPLETPD